MKRFFEKAAYPVYTVAAVTGATAWRQQQLRSELEAARAAGRDVEVVTKLVAGMPVTLVVDKKQADSTPPAATPGVKS